MTTERIVIREDLSRRTALSKSTLVAFDLCQTRAWLQRHDPRPFVTNEKVVFGAAIDAGTEVIVKYAAMGQPPDMARANAAAAEMIAEAEIAIDTDEVDAALTCFERDVVPKFDWAYTVTQPSITAVIDELGECNGHPDIVLGDGRIYDVKTSARPKDVPSIELAFYAILAEAVGGRAGLDGRVSAVGYMNWVRVRRPYWHVAEVPVTDELRRWAFEKSAAYIRAKKADDYLNANRPEPGNFSFTGSARFAGLCADCVYGPALGGPCLVALKEEIAE